MKAQLLKIAGVKSEKEFYNKYPTEEAFFEAHPEAQMMMRNGGEMIKRADGSYSKRGLWDNIRANRGSGKKPTSEMLEQERKINAKAQLGGVMGGFNMGMIQDKQNQLMGMADGMQKKYGPMLMQLAPMLLQDGGEPTPAQILQEKIRKQNEITQAGAVLTDAFMKKGGSTYSGGVWFQDGGDSTLENIAEVFDPTGISSWDDVYRSYKESGVSPQTAIELLGAIPMLGKAGKLTKAGIHLAKYKGLEKLMYNALPKSNTISKALNGAGLIGRGSDAIQAAQQAPTADYLPFKKGGSTYSGGVWFQDGGEQDAALKEKVFNAAMKGVDKAAAYGLKGAKWVGKNVFGTDDIVPDFVKDYVFNTIRPVSYPKNMSQVAAEFIRSDKAKPGRDANGDLGMEEEAWSRVLRRPTQSKYFVPSQYKPTVATDPNAEYYQMAPGVIDEERMKRILNDNYFSRNGRKNKAGKEYVPMQSLEPFMSKQYMNAYKKRTNTPFTETDPLANFQVYRDKDPKTGKPYLSISDTYDFDGMESPNEFIKPMNVYHRVYGKGGSTYSGGVWFENGGIHINPANKGKFTASAQHAGMGVQEFASHVLANKEDYSPTQVKRANFARNASKWKHEYGGVPMMQFAGNTPMVGGKPFKPAPFGSGANQFTAPQQLDLSLTGQNPYLNEAMKGKQYDPNATGLAGVDVSGMFAKNTAAGNQQFAPNFNQKLGAVQNKLAQGMAGDPFIGAVGNIIEGINNHNDYNDALNKQRQNYSTDYAYNTSNTTANNKGQYDMYGTMMPNQIGGNLSFTGMNQKYNMVKNMYELGGAYETSSTSWIPQAPDAPTDAPFFVAAPKANNFDMAPTKAAPAVENTTRMNFNLNGNFQDYATKAQNYLNKVAPNTDIKGVDLAAAAQEAYKAHGTIVPVELALAQLKQEGYLAQGSKPNKPQRTKNPFNVGNTDNGSTVDHSSLYSGIQAYYNLMASQYLKNKSPEQLLQNFTNSKGNRYASDKRYESSLKDIIGTMKLKEGGEYDLTEDEIQNIMRMGGQIEYC